ncbi:hypothetical protein FZ041_09970 [Selenomonas caprae]|uniref:Phosphoglucomutase/phosphomannomutase, alpha/beta/alpha domain II n=2 Tax=Selenomonas TaxID=970 RepID=A0A1I3GWS4_SELRU|nr:MULTISPECIES: hypothetical protein [Selenomonas]MBQ1889411.1 hypothetical protein [Selenomonas sp.]TYZ27822.1 hypothetical protein FZ041_09970 [Selenomonas caprae]SFI27786.1 Phosphoglucomutase/phosphomannomutase, alpha/beta/alpha domain II [Selenomonas ruminantium]
MDSVSKEVRLVQEVYDLRELEKKIAASDFDADNDGTAEVVDVDVMQAYVDGLLAYVDGDKLKPYKVVANTVNGPAGPIINALEKKLPFDIVKVNNVFDRSFPYGVPDSADDGMRAATAAAVREQEADMGVLWDLDLGRCCLFDETGRCIPGECGERGMLVWLLVLELLARSQGKKLSELLAAEAFSWQDIAERLKAARC